MNKACNKCGRDLPATAEFFSAAREIKSGLRGTCKDCDRLRHKSYRERNPEKVAEWKRRWLEANPEYMPAYLKGYYERNADAARAKHAEYRAQHREEARDRDRSYYARNRDKFRVTNNERRMRERGAGSHSTQDIAAQLKRQRGCCYWCGVNAADDYHVDHVVPIAKDGSNGPENLVISCPACNRSKGAKMPHEFSDRLC